MNSRQSRSSRSDAFKRIGARKSMKPRSNPNQTNSSNDTVSLLKSCAKGNVKSFSALLQLEKQRMYASARQFVGGVEADALDILQEASLKIFTEAKRFRFSEYSDQESCARAIRAWITQIITNTALNWRRQHARRRRREQKIVEFNRLDQEQLIQSNENTLLQEKAFSAEAQAAVKAMHTLPEKIRDVLILRFLNDHSITETAKILHIPISTVQSRTRAGLQKLKAELVGSFGISAAVFTKSSPEQILSAPAFIEVSPEADQILSQAVAASQSVSLLTPEIDESDYADSMDVSPTTSSPVSAVTVLIVATVALAGGIFYPGATTPSSSPKQVDAELASKPLEEISKPEAVSSWEYSWNFDDGKIPSELKALYGARDIKPDGGVNNSPCVEVSKHVVFVLDVPIPSLPAVITLETSGTTTDAKPKESLDCLWSESEFSAFMVGHRKSGALGVEVGRFVQNAVYLTKDSTDVWVDNKRMSTQVCPRGNNSKPTLIFSGKIKIDNLAIRSLEPNQIPDISQFATAVKQVPPDKRIGFVELPQLAFHGKNIMAYFITPSTSNPHQTANGGNVLYWSASRDSPAIFPLLQGSWKKVANKHARPKYHMAPTSKDPVIAKLPFAALNDPFEIQMLVWTSKQPGQPDSDFLSSASLFWMQNGKPVPHTHWSNKNKSGSYSNAIQAVFIKNYIFEFRNGDLVDIREYQTPYPGNQVGLHLKNSGLETLRFRNGPKKELLQSLKNPKALIRRFKLEKKD